MTYLSHQPETQTPGGAPAARHRAPTPELRDPARAGAPPRLRAAASRWRPLPRAHPGAKPRRGPRGLALLCTGALWLALPVVGGEPPPAPLPPFPGYEYRSWHNPDGTGKFFLGREIAQVMGHQGAAWLERPTRGLEEGSDWVVPALGVKKGETVADIGAGTGYFSWRLAQAVGPTGTVYAVDIQQEMLDDLNRAMTARSIHNVQTVLGHLDDPQLPAGTVDLALMVDVYHEFSEPYAMLEAICTALKPDGRVVFVEYRAEDPTVPIKPLHKMTVAQVRREAALHPLVWVKTIETLPRQHIIIFRKRTP